MRLLYNKDQIKQAAKFIWKKNPHAASFATSREDIVNKITASMLKFAANKYEGCSYTATAGYFILFSWEDEDTMVAHVLVEPNIGRDYIDYTEVLL